MYVTLVLTELATSLRESIARRFTTHPRTSMILAAVCGLLVLLLAWSALSAIFWPTARNVYGSVSGTLTSVTGSPVANALVLFVDDAAGVGASGRTDSAGAYTAYGVQPGTYTVAIQPVIDVGNGELTKEVADKARSLLEASVPRRFQEASTSGLSAELKHGRNRYDIDLSGKR